MNRLQKKCVIGTAGIHLLLLTILIFGPAFFNRPPKTDNTVLDVIPANLVDAALNSGVRDAQAPPPAPAPAVIPPQLLQPPPPLPAPTPEPRVVQPTPPAEVPTPSLLDKFEKMFQPTKPTPPTPTPDLKPVRRTEKSHDENIKVNLTPVRHTNHSHNSNPDNNAKEINTELRSLSHSLSSSTHIDMPGTGSEASASYDAVVRSVYLQAVVANLPAQLAHDVEHTLVKVTIARDGTVISSTISSPSGDTAWDNAVQRTLDQVTSVAKFPDSWSEQQRTFSLDFNPQVAKELQ